MPLLNTPNYDRLIIDPAGETLKLFDAIERPFHMDSLGAFEKLWVQEAMSEPDDLSAAPEKTSNNFSRKASWDQLSNAGFSDEDHAVLINMWPNTGSN
ncbi:MAG: hypothetical protein JKY31_04870 [Rhodobacteraceae bacterium]|nr:hypothetical protein [Paracoccaceae bacterium]